MATKNNVIIVPPTPVYNTDSVPVFENFTPEDSALLYSTLYSNYIDVLSRFNGNIDSTFIFDSRDMEFLPENISQSPRCKFYENGEKWNLVSSVSSKIINQEGTNLLVFFSHSIGISPARINSLFNLLNNDDNNIVAGISSQDKLAFYGINHFDPLLFEEINPFTSGRDDFLRMAGKMNNYLFALDGFFTVETLDDFRELYKLLSTKESIEYCSHEIHEQFTNLFIEYKELL